MTTYATEPKYSISIVDTITAWVFRDPKTNNKYIVAGGGYGTDKNFYTDEKISRAKKNLVKVWDEFELTEETYQLNVGDTFNSDLVAPMDVDPIMVAIFGPQYAYSYAQKINKEVN